ncbi:DMT family transporter [Paraburkholderia bannensis]|uniref:DMT family transporter n=1 Tax=Paraburkholderia bannensis TaxID=765414 RepID=UPI002ABD4138|nr:EamA family transporter [Paraburkholderia bannensis]
MKDKRIYFFLIGLFVLTWSSAFVATKFALTVCPPNLFLGFRFIAAGSILLAVAAVKGQLRAPLPWARIAILGLLNQAAYYGLAWAGMETTSSGLATLITSLNPVLVSVAAWPVLGESLSPRKAAGLVLGLTGAALVVRDRIAFGEDAHGVMLISVALLCMVAGTLAFKKFNLKESLIVVVGGQQLCAGVTLLAVGLGTERVTDISVDMTFWLSLVWHIGVVSIGAFSLWFYLLSEGSATSASSLHFLMPPVGLVMSWLILHEPLRAADLAGTVPIGIGIWLVTRRAALVPRPISQTAK